MHSRQSKKWDLRSLAARRSKKRRSSWKFRGSEYLTNAYPWRSRSLPLPLLSDRGRWRWRETQDELPPVRHARTSNGSQTTVGSSQIK